MDFESKKRLRRERARLKHLKKLGLLREAGEEREAVKAAEPAEVKGKRPEKAGILGKIGHIYESEYKKLLWITIILLVRSFAQIGYQIATTGDFLNKGVALKGGITITAAGAEYDAILLEQQLNERFEKYDIGVRKLTSAGRQTGIVVDADITDKEEIDNFLDFLNEKMGIARENYSLEVTGASLGTSFFREALIALLVAFIFMGITV